MKHDQELIKQLTALNQSQEIEIESLQLELHKYQTYTWTYFISLLIAIGYIVATLYTNEVMVLKALVFEWFNNLF